MKRIESLEELKKITSNHPTELFIMLNYGLRSSKQVEYNPENKRWYIYNYIDDTEQELSEDLLAEDTNIIKAIDNKSLFLYK